MIEIGDTVRILNYSDALNGQQGVVIDIQNTEVELKLCEVTLKIVKVPIKSVEKVEI